MPAYFSARYSRPLRSWAKIPQKSAKNSWKTLDKRAKMVYDI
jgi:hypothetical protein